MVGFNYQMNDESEENVLNYHLYGCFQRTQSKC